MINLNTHSNRSRRAMLRMGLGGLGVPLAMPLMFRRMAGALAADDLEGRSDRPERILVVVELSGGNDGLNTVVPFREDEYYRVRPTLAISRNDVLKVSDEAGFHPSLVGFERLYKDGLLAVVEGCGYPNPSLSHFSSMGFWHTGVPNGGEPLGWIGRLQDALTPAEVPNATVNIASSQSLAVRGRVHSPLVFDNPNQLRRVGTDAELGAIAGLSRGATDESSGLAFLRSTSKNATSSGKIVRDAWSSYQTPVDYGIGGGLASDLQKVAALIAAKLPTRIYYVTYRGNAFDTHVHQADLHARILMYASDAIRGFIEDLARIGRGDDVAIMVFTEFGRRIEENASQGTDHGTAGPMFIVGRSLKGGFYGRPPSLVDTDDGNLIMTTDFRSVYATMIAEWMGYRDTDPVLKGTFEPLGMFAG